MRLVIKIKEKTKSLNNEKSYGRLQEPSEMNDAEELENEEKTARLGAASDGKCKPERGDFACYMVDAPSSTQHSKGIIKTEPTKPQIGYRKGKK